MSYPKNAATPPRIAVGAVVQISDGAVQTSGVSIRVVPQGGSAAAGLGTTSYEDGIVLYAPTQAETNYEAFVVIAYKTGCIPASTTVVTSASATAGYSGVDWSKVTSATSTVNLSGTTIKTATDVETDTQDIQSRLPTALVSGRMDVSVGAYQSGLTPLQPTVAGRTLDVSAGGEAGIDWANIGSPTTSVAFTNTTISTSQVVASVTGNVGGNVTGSVGSISGVTFPGNFGSLAITVGGAVTAGTVSDKTGYTLSASGLASITAWTVAITGNITGNLSGSVGSVTGAVGSVAAGVTVTTNNDKTGYSLTQSFPSNFASLAITAGGAVTAGTVSDKTGYSLTQSFPTNFSSLAITAGGSVTAGTVSDKTGYSLTQAFPTNFSSMAISASGVVDANTVLWGGSTLPTVGTSTLTASQVWSHATRTLTAFAFTPNVNVTQWDGGSLPTIGTSTLTASDVWTHATRTLTAFGFNVTVGTNNDKTGYVLTQAFPINFSSLAITAGGSVTAGTVSDKTGYSLTQAFPTNFSSLGINASGHISRVTLVDTTTTNTDMRGTDGAALASIWTSTVAGRIDAAISTRSSHSAADVWSVATRTLTAFNFSVTVGANNDKTGYSLATAPLDASGTAAAVWGASLSSYTSDTTFGGRILRTDQASSGNGAKVTGAGHVAADIHEIQPAVIQSTHFAAGAVDANALAADAASQIASAVRTNLATELGRIDATTSSRASQTSVDALTGYVDTEVAAIKAKTDNLPASPAAVGDIPTAVVIADAVLSRSVTNVEATAGEHTLCTLILAGLESSITGTTWTIRRTGGTTHYTKTVTTDSGAAPVVGVT